MAGSTFAPHNFFEMPNDDGNDDDADDDVELLSVLPAVVKFIHAKMDNKRYGKLSTR